MSSRQAAGQRAEGWALTHLEEYGLQLVARNWRCRHGELDLVMNEGQGLVFIEVRYRASTHWGGAEASVDHLKRQRLIATAHTFLQQHLVWLNKPCRFDIVAIHAGTRHQAPQLNWIQGAFDH